MSEIINILGELLKKKDGEISAWFSGARMNTPPFYYCSVDIRHSGRKIAPVDTNLFPAGFNNLSERNRESAISETKKYFNKYHPDTKKILIIPENHTRNLFYLENIYVLNSIIESAGFETQIGGLEVTTETQLETKSGKKISIQPLILKDAHLATTKNDFIPDIVVVNNDFSSGAPPILSNIKQKLLPGIGFGWYRRRKTIHFDSYAHITNEFSHNFGIDPWLISAIFHKCGKVNFREKIGLECVALGVERVISKIQKKYNEYGVKDEPYVFVKADSGTYGMGIMTAKSGKDILEINKKSRHKMDVIKEGVTNTEVIIQEGVPTIDMVDGKTAEPMMYLIGGNPVGCSYRINASRDAYSNLNSPGMEFQNVCEGDTEVLGSHSLCPAQGLIAKLAELAAARENHEIDWDI